MAMAPQLVGSVGCVVDLSAAYRLKDASHYPDVLRVRARPARAARRRRVRPARAAPRPAQGASLIATPGCYVTAATLALRPLVEAGVIATTGVIVDAASGVTGAGRKADHAHCSPRSTRTSPPTGCSATGTRPRWSRRSAPSCSPAPPGADEPGILATCYAKPAPGRRPLDRGAARAAARGAARASRSWSSPTVRRRPSRRSASNAVHVTARFDARTRRWWPSPPSTTSPRAPAAAPSRAANVASASTRRPGSPGRRGAVSAHADEHAEAAAGDPGRGAAVHPALRRQGRGGQVRRQRPRRGIRPRRARPFAEDVVLMRLVGMRPVVVHGGGPQISDLMSRLGKQRRVPRRPARHRRRDRRHRPHGPRSARSTRSSCGAINVHGHYAVGVSGEDAGLIRARAPRPRASASSATSRRSTPTILDRLLDDEFIPVVATIGTDAPGQAYNINADTVAGAIAEALGAEKLGLPHRHRRTAPDESTTRRA